MDISLLNKLWQVDNDITFQQRIEDMLGDKNIDYISTPRSSGQRGGGAAIAVRKCRFSLTKCNILIPQNVECVWGIVKPLTPMKNRVNQIICCSFYSPPVCNKNTPLLEHIGVTLQKLMTSYPNSAVFLGGDRNKMLLKDFSEIDSSLKQMVHKPTRGKNVLDIILTNVHTFYSEAEILPPLQPDTVGIGVQSDHHGVLLKSNKIVNQNLKYTKHIRTFPDSAIFEFGREFVQVNWDNLDSFEDPTKMASYFEEQMDFYVAKYFPLKKITVSPLDKPYFNEEFRLLRRQRQRCYKKFGKTEKYVEIKNRFDSKLLIEKQKYREKLLKEVKEGKRGSTYSALKKMSLHCDQVQKPEFILPKHQLLNLLPLQCAEKISDYFV